MKVNVIIRDAVWEVVSFYCYKWEGVGLENSLMVMLVVMPAILKKFRRVLVGQVNDGEVRQMDWRVSKGFYLMNTCFNKGKSWLITFQLSDIEMEIDYIFVNNRYRGLKSCFNILGHDVINLLYYEHWTGKQKYFYIC